MAAPSGITWGSTVGSYGRIGIYTSTTETSTQVKMHVEVWFWSKYSVSDSSNTYYYDNLSSSGSATTSRGSKTIKTTVASGDGWSTSNQIKLASADYTYTKGTSASTRYLYAKLANIDRVGGTMYVSKTISIPKLASYTVSYNANGGSGVPSSQTKWYGKTLTLSSTKPTRSGYTFVGWGTNATDTSKDYSPSGSYTANSGITLYAIWSKTITLAYNANGGSGAPSAQSATVYNATTSKAFTISSTVPKRSGYNFLGWAKTSSATSAAYKSGNSYTLSSSGTLYAVWTIAYIAPKISGISVNRCTSEGVLSDEGTYALVKCNWSTFNTVSSIKIDWTSTSGGSGSTNISASGTSGSVSAIIGNGELSTESNYNIAVTVVDSGGSSVATKPLPGYKFPIDVKAGGKGVSLGKPAELDDTFDVAYASYFRKEAVSCHTDIAYRQTRTRDDGLDIEVGCGIGGGGYNHGLWHDRSDWASGGWLLYSDKDDDLRLGVTRPPQHITWVPYYRAGHSLTTVLDTAGYCTDAMTQIHFIIPLAKPVIGSPTVTVTSNNGFTLRCNDKYTHGSSATVATFPSKITATLENSNHLHVVAEFSNTTNATNNAAYGIRASIIITFS